MSGVSFLDIRGYVAGGNNTVDLGTVNSILYSTGTLTSSPILSYVRSGLTGITQGNQKGYFAGGQDPTGAVKYVEILYFANGYLSNMQSGSFLPNYLAASVSKFSQGSNISYIMSGLITVGNSTSYTYIKSAVASGTVLVTGKTKYALDGVLSLPINYRILEGIDTGLPINYQQGRKVLYAFRIEGICLDLTNGEAPFINTAIQCTARSIQTIIASNPKEACQKLIDQGWMWPVKRFQRYTKPIYKEDEEYLEKFDLYDSNDVRFVDEPFCTYKECLDFCADFLVNEIITLQCNALLSNNIYTMSGDVYVSGSVSITSSKFSYQAKGTIVVGGSFGVSTSWSVTNYTGSGNVLITGSGTVVSSYLGEFIEDSTIESEITTIDFIYGITSGLALKSTSLNSFIDQCECNNLQNRFNLVTNFDRRPSKFTNFITSSNLTFNPIFVMNYNKTTGIYLYNKHFINASRNESWSITATLVCDDDLNNFQTYSTWVCNINFKHYKKSLSNNTLDTNIRVWIPSEIICPSTTGNNMSFDITININSKVAITRDGKVLNNVYINDQIGLFTSTSWTSTPDFRIYYLAFGEQ